MTGNILPLQCRCRFILFMHRFGAMAWLVNAFFQPRTLLRVCCGGGGDARYISCLWQSYDTHRMQVIQAKKSMALYTRELDELHLK